MAASSSPLPPNITLPHHFHNTLLYLVITHTDQALYCGGSGGRMLWSEDSFDVFSPTAPTTAPVLTSTPSLPTNYFVIATPPKITKLW